MNTYRWRRIKTGFRKMMGLQPRYAVVCVNPDIPTTILDPTIPGNVFVQEQYANGYGKPISVRGPTGTSVQLSLGSMVELQPTSDNRLKIVNYSDPANAAAGINTLAANLPALPSSGYVGQQSVITALVCPEQTPDLTVIIKAWVAIVAGTRYAFAGTPSGGFDLSGSVPSAGNNLIAVVFVNSDYATPSVGVSTARATSDLPLGDSDIQQALTAGLVANPGATPLAAIRLYGGQTQIMQADILEDERQLINNTGSSGAPLAVTDGVTTVGDVSEIDFTGATVTDLGGGIAGVAVTGGSGDVVGPASAVDNDLALFDGVTGKLIKDSGILASAIALIANLKYQILKVSGTAQTARGKFNLIAGTNVTITPVDNSGADSTDVTFDVSSASLIDSKDLFVSTASAAVTTTSPTSLFGSGAGSLTLPADFLTVGKALKLTLTGIYTTALVPPTLTITIKLGSTTIITTGAVTLVGSLTNQWFQLEVLLTCRTSGPTGTVIAQGAFMNAESTVGLAMLVLPLVETTINTIDTTASQVIDATATLSSATGSSVTCTNAIAQAIDIENAGEGNVIGPVSSTDRAVATWSGTSGQDLRDNANNTIDGSGNASDISEKVTGTAGAGFVEVVAQSSDPSAPSATGLRFFADASGYLAWRIKNGSDTFKRLFNGVLTAARTYTWPDASGNVVLDSATQTLTNKSIAASEINSGQLALANGGTGADLSGTGPGVPVQPTLGGALSIESVLNQDLVNWVFKSQCVTVSTTNISISSPPGTIGGQTYTSGNQRILLAGQSTGSQNGIWIWTGSGNPLTRPTDFATGLVLPANQSLMIFVQVGTNAATFWVRNSQTSATVDTTSLSFSLVPSTVRNMLQSTDQTDILFGFKCLVDAVADTNINIASIPSSIDGVPTNAGAIRVLLTNQSTPSQNGLWFASSGFAATRPPDYASGYAFAFSQGITVEAGTGGTTYKNTRWRCTTAPTVTVDTTATAWAQIVVALAAIPNLPASIITSGTLPISTLKVYLAAIIGDGSDGAFSASSGTTTLSRDMYWTDITLTGTAKINTAGYRIFHTGKLDQSAAGAGSIFNDGGTGGNASSGTGGSGGTAPSSNTVGGGSAGPSGANGRATSGAGTNGTPGVASSPGNGGAGGDGGNGGAGTGGAGGTAQTGGAVSSGLSIHRWLVDTLRGVSLLVGGASGASGSSGGSNGAQSGGGGQAGSGAGVVYISGWEYARGGSTATGAISAKGGLGGNGASSAGAANGDGGGGGGGGGGWIIGSWFVFSGSAATNNFDASGGAGGNAGAAGGTLATVASGGNGGAGGRITLINMSTGVVTETTGSAGTAHSGRTGGAGNTFQASL